MSPAAWITDSDRPWQELVGFGPSGFSAYARLRFLPDPAYQGQDETHADGLHDPRSETEQLRIALDTLAVHTATPEQCYFCPWEGWGELQGGDGARPLNRLTRGRRRGPRIQAAFARAVLDGPKVVIPHRAYYLFRGSLADFGDWGAADMWPGQPRVHMPVPAFIWPADHAWCVARDVDPHWAGMGGGPSALDLLIAHPELDVVPADPQGEQPYYR